MAKLYAVKRVASQREQLRALVSKGEGKVQRMRRAQTLLLADAGKADQTIAEVLQVHRATVERTRRRFAEEGLEAALSRRKASRAPTPAKARRGGRGALDRPGVRRAPGRPRAWTLPK